MEYVNVLRAHNSQRVTDSVVTTQNLTVLAQLLAPFAPHIAEEAWEGLGHKFSVHKSEWPEWDEEMIKQDQANIAVQVNGKFRGTITLASEDVKNQELAEQKARENENVSKWIKDKQMKVVYVEGRIINFVT